MTSTPAFSWRKPNGWLLLLILASLFTFVFWSSFKPGIILFANDGPLGAVECAARHLPESFFGNWYDLNSLGEPTAAWPSLTFVLQWVLGPLGFAKFYAPIALVILGMAAWAFFRQMGLGWAAGLLGAIAVALNSTYFSVACWGLGEHSLTAAMTFAALAAVADTTSGKRWMRLVLAGFAVGMGVSEGADIGAMFSLVVAAFVVYQAWAVLEGPVARNLTMGVGRVALVAVCAGFIAAQTIATLVTTSIQGMTTGKQDVQSKAERWDWATQWSVPKREALGLFVPGLFGYRMDTPDGGVYWGASGRDAAWDRYFAGGSKGPAPQGFMRYSGGGFYAGVPVVLIAIWAGLQARRKKDSVFSPVERKLLWFWLGVSLVALLLAFGRYAPFYQFLYALPYFSSVRNPSKWVHILTFALLVLFGYGVDGLWRRYLQPATVGPAGLWDRVKSGWAKAPRFDRRWITGCAIALGACLLGWMIYASQRPNLEAYLQTVQFDDTNARMIAEFTLRTVGWFVLFFVLGAGLLALILTGAFSGQRAKWGVFLLGLLLVIDLTRANQPWIIYWNYPQKYADNPVLQFLQDKPYEHRVASLPFRLPPELSLLEQLYRLEWMQHHFLYYNIQSLDIIQMPRMPADLQAYETALFFNGDPANLYKLTRRWQLTNTRYLLGPAGFLDVLNQQVDPQHRFRIVQAFAVAPKPGIVNPSKLEDVTAMPTTNGPYAVFEFTGALPRAKLYANWQVSTNDQVILTNLAGPTFDPTKTVLVAGGPGVPAAPAGTNQNAGTVQYTTYGTKDFVLQADAASPAILLVNDRFNPNWKVLVDGKPEPLLRCNYIMRGVALNPGQHKVEFQYRPPLGTLYLSFAALVLGLLLLGILAVDGVRRPPGAEPAVPEPAPAPPRKEPRALSRAR
jgi:hypothetical protein